VPQAGKNTMVPDMGPHYDYGQGGTVEQETSRTTGVTINRLVGQIELVSAAGSTTAAAFVVTNGQVSADDCVVAWVKSGTDPRRVDVIEVADGSFKISTNTISGTTTEQPVIGFAVIKADIA
jgi:hypothetical protein